MILSDKGVISKIHPEFEDLSSEELEDMEEEGEVLPKIGRIKKEEEPIPKKLDTEEVMESYEKAIRDVTLKRS